MINIINMHDIMIIGIFENFGYLKLLIIKQEIIALNNNAIYGVYNPVK